MLNSGRPALKREMLWCAALVWCSNHVLAAAGLSSGDGAWPPLSVGQNQPSEYGFPPRAFFYHVCGAQYCDAFGGTGPSRQPTSDMYEARQYPLSVFVANASDSASDGSEERLPLALYTKVSPPGSPPARSGGRMVLLYSPQLNEFVSFIFGGTAADGTPDNSAYYYRYDEELWIYAAPPADVNQQPPPLTMFAMVSLGGSNFTVFFGASSTLGLVNSVFEGVLDASTMLLTQFRRMQPISSSILPAPRVSPCCVASLARRVTVCFGGADGFNLLNDTWWYDHDAVTWTLLPYDAAYGAPSPRFDAMCTYRSNTDEMILLGGFKDSSRTPVADNTLFSFRFATRRWYASMVLPSQIAQRGGGALYFTNNETVMEVLGGQSATGVLGDRWALSASELNSVFDDEADGGTASTSNEKYAAESIKVEKSTFVGNPSAVKIESDSLVPEARQFHSSAQLGQGMLVAFGKGTQLYSSAYYCLASVTPDPANECTWFSIVSPSGSTPAARFGASACAQGNVVYFFGGFLSLDKATMANDLWALTVNFSSINHTSHTITAYWNQITAASGADAAAASYVGIGKEPLKVVANRAYHQCILSQNQLAVVGGLVGTQYGVSNDISAFDLQRQVWYTVTVTPPFAPRAGFSLHWNGTAAVIVGGYTITGTGQQVLRDAFLIVPDRTTPYAVLTYVLNLDYPILRAFGATAGSGNTFLLCGGAIYVTQQLSVGPPMEVICMSVAVRGLSGSVYAYQMTRLNSNMQPVEAAGIGGSAAFIGDAYVYFGGSLVENQIEREYTFFDTTQTFVLTSLLCSLEAVQAAQADGSGQQLAELSCFLCGAGSVNPTAAAQQASDAGASCTFAPPGHFVTSTNMSLTPCSLGRASSASGASSSDACELCPEGSFANTTGSSVCRQCPVNYTCPLGAVAPRSSGFIVSTASEVQPPIMAEGETPPIIFLAAGVMVFTLLVFLGVVSYVSYRVRRTRRDYFFNEGATLVCRQAYQNYKRSHFGLDLERLTLALQDLGVTHLPEDFLRKVLAENDQDGAAHVTFPSFQEVVIAFIEKGLLRPFPGTGEDTNPGKSVTGIRRTFASFRFKDLDSYDTDHALGVEGEAIRIHSTVSGGVTRVCFNILAIGVALALIGQFVYTNISETRSTTPSVGMDDSGPIAAREIRIDVTASGGVQTASECSLSPSGVSGACAKNTGFSALSSGTAVVSNFTQLCEYRVETLSCTIHLIMNDASLTFGQALTISAGFGWSVYAQQLSVNVSSTTGVDDDVSQSSLVYAAESPADVFRGYPASTFTFPVLPTSFETVDNVVVQSSKSSSGYHVLLGVATGGNLIDATQVTQYFGVPVTIVFEVDSNVLSVKRLPKATLLDFLSQMLGSITGMGGILVTLMKMYDSKFISSRHDKLRVELEEAVLTGVGGDALELRRRESQHCKPGHAAGLDEELISMNRVQVDVATS